MTHKTNLLTYISCYLLLMIWTLSCAIPVYGKEHKLAVAGFRALPEDMTAMMAGTEYYDQNGIRAALIKVETNNRDFSFEVGSLGVVRKEEQNPNHPAEIWVYVPEKIKFIEIQHPTLGSTGHVPIDISVERGRTYRLELTGDDVETIVIDHEHQRNLTVKTIPSSATLTINGVVVKTATPGEFPLPLSHGKYTYQVSAPHYHTSKSTLIVNESTDSVINIRLSQAFGYLSIPTIDKTMDGAELFIDGNAAGPLSPGIKELDSGSHSIKITKKLYIPYVKNINIADSMTTLLQPILLPNYAKASITVTGDKSAEIYVDGERIGIGNWQGKLEAGKHLLEARKASHVSSRKEVNVVKDVETAYSLAAPTPQYGTLSILSNPPGADVYLDNEKQSRGKTPFVDSKILIGEHKITLSLKGHREESFECDLKEGETVSKSIPLIGICSASVISSPYGHLYINGRYAGSTPYQLNETPGEYQLKVVKEGYLDYSKRLKLNGRTGDIRIKLHRNFVNPNEFYLQGGYTLSGDGLISIGAGGYVKNVNIEANYLMGVKESETIYWSSQFSDSMPESTIFKPSGGNVKAGYGFPFFGHLRITPQIGIQFLTFKEGTGGTADGMKAVSFLAGGRLSFVIVKYIGISVSPEWKMAVGKSEGFKAVSEISKSIKGYANGIGCNFSLNIIF